MTLCNQKTDIILDLLGYQPINQSSVVIDEKSQYLLIDQTTANVNNLLKNQTNNLPKVQTNNLENNELSFVSWEH